VKYELIDAANRLRLSEQPIDLKRAVSTAYYALFHALSESNAEALIGPRDASSTQAVWHDVYRALDHSQLKDPATSGGFPKEISSLQSIVLTATDLKRKRHEADYNPSYDATKADATAAVSAALAAIIELEKCSIEERKALAVHLLVWRRRK
jgi:uncharacterized protein (UPF0332 family)